MKIYKILVDNKTVKGEIIASFTDKKQAEQFKNSCLREVNPQIIESETITKYFDNVIIIDQETKLKDFEEIKKLAYEIRKNKEAFYLTTRFSIETEDGQRNNTIQELEHYFRINNDIIKFITISIGADEL